MISFGYRARDDWQIKKLIFPFRPVMRADSQIVKKGGAMFRQSQLAQLSYRDRILKICNINISESEAKALWTKITKHQEQMQSQLKRAVEISVAALDYLKNYVTNFRDIILVEKRKYDDAMTNAYKDPLTGLYNRRYLIENLEKEVKKACRYHLTFSMLFIDLDHFKEINDRFGHVIGDMVLRRAAELILEMSRTSDLVARYGGEEFVLLMPQTTSQVALKVAQRLRVSFHRETTKTDHFFNTGLTISGGIVSCPYDADCVKNIIDFADKALYFAKKNGRDKIYRYKDVIERIDLPSEIKAKRIAI